MNYQIVISEEILQEIKKYRSNLLSKAVKAGKYLHEKVTKLNLNDTNLCEFIQLLLSTKKPRIFAESEVQCNGTDWNSTEFSILGGINVVMEAWAYDNGVWYASMSAKYNDPLDIELLFTPGIMLNICATGLNNPDYGNVVEYKKINQEKYNALIEKRLLPLLAYSNYKAGNKKALIVLPGIGCGNFAGDFHGQMESKLDKALQAMIEKHQFPNIQGIQLGLYENKLNVEPKIINDIVYEVRGTGLPQLSNPEKWDMKHKNCKLYKVVAWDHVSLPGNDFFYHNSRSTDDGVSAAATNSMEVITGIKGLYTKGKYVPPSKYRDWEGVIESEGIKLIANESNIKVVSKDGQYHDIDAYVNQK